MKVGVGAAVGTVRLATRRAATRRRSRDHYPQRLRRLKGPCHAPQAAKGVARAQRTRHLPLGTQPKCIGLGHLGE